MTGAFEDYADQYVPFKLNYLEGLGEYIEFDALTVMATAIKACGLEEFAQANVVSISDSIDGAQTSKNLGHVCYGIKVIDRRSTDPTNWKD